MTNFVGSKTYASKNTGPLFYLHQTSSEKARLWAMADDLLSVWSAMHSI